MATTATQIQSPTTPNPTPPEEGGTGGHADSSDVELVIPQAQPTLTAQQTTSSQQQQPPTAASSSDAHRGTRTWDRVEQALVDIRRMARTFEDSQGRGEAIASAADAALVDLLVDTPTALELEAEAPQEGTNIPAAAAALHAAQQLRGIARTLLERRGNSLLPYPMVAPHVGALIRWLGGT